MPNWYFTRAHTHTRRPAIIAPCTIHNTGGGAAIVLDWTCGVVFGWGGASGPAYEPATLRGSWADSTVMRWRTSLWGVGCMSLVLVLHHGSAPCTGGGGGGLSEGRRGTAWTPKTTTHGTSSLVRRHHRQNAWIYSAPMMCTTYHPEPGGPVFPSPTSVRQSSLQSLPSGRGWMPRGQNAAIVSTGTDMSVSRAKMHAVMPHTMRQWGGRLHVHHGGAGRDQRANKSQRAEAALLSRGTTAPVSHRLGTSNADKQCRHFAPANPNQC